MAPQDIRLAEIHLREVADDAPDSRGEEGGVESKRSGVCLGLGPGGLDEEVEAVDVAEAGGGFEEVVGDVGWVEDFVRAGGGDGRGLGGEGDGVGVDC